MKNSEDRIAPVTAVCDRRQTDPKNPAACWSVAAFVREPQIDFITATFRPSMTPAQSNLIKPNRAIFPFFDSTSDPKTAKSRNWQLARPVRSDRPANPQLSAPACRAQGSAKAEALVKVEIRNPQSAIRNSTTTPCGAPSATPQQFHLIPPNSTSRPRRDY